MLKLTKKKQKKQHKKKSSFLAKSPAVESAGPKTKESVQQGAKRKVEEKAVAKLPGAESFWSTGGAGGRKQQQQPPSDSSDDEENDRVEVPAKKSRLTAKERFEAMRQEEKRIRQIEEELADSSVDPHTPDQFDRMLLAQPNSSLLWIRYMVFHMESAEIDKARAVARRALKTINFREENERLNVWIALLNLELRYETIETFKEILQEAVQYNDPYKVYSKVIEVLIDCGKTAEVLDMTELLQKRFRKQPEMWHLIASCFYKIGHRSKVKPLLSKALKSLENKDRKLNRTPPLQTKPSTTLATSHRHPPDRQVCLPAQPQRRPGRGAHPVRADPHLVPEANRHLVPVRGHAGQGRAGGRGAPNAGSGHRAAAADAEHEDALHQVRQL